MDEGYGMKTPQPVAGMRHVALSVTSLEACERFYVDVLGMRVEWRPDADKRPGFLQSSRHFLRGNLRRIVCHPIDLSSLLESAGNLNNAGQP